MLRRILHWVWPSCYWCGKLCSDLNINNQTRGDGRRVHITCWSEEIDVDYAVGIEN